MPLIPQHKINPVEDIKEPEKVKPTVFTFDTYHTLSITEATGAVTIVKRAEPKLKGVVLHTLTMQGVNDGGAICYVATKKHGIVVVFKQDLYVA
jgi:aminopeptidase-like protein